MLPIPSQSMFFEFSSELLDAKIENDVMKSKAENSIKTRNVTKTPQNERE